MLRNLIIAGAIIIVFMLLKRHFGRKQSSASTAKPTESMVQCAQCKTYILETEAISSGNDYFCCKQHQQTHKN